jgi:hypothetical protein
VKNVDIIFDVVYNIVYTIGKNSKNTCAIVGFDNIVYNIVLQLKTYDIYVFCYILYDIVYDIAYYIVYNIIYIFTYLFVVPHKYSYRQALCLNLLMHQVMLGTIHLGIFRTSSTHFKVPCHTTLGH